MSAFYLAIALQYAATTYGFGELYCSDYDMPPAPCDETAITASGVQFNPNVPMAAIPMPRNRILRPSLIWLKAHDGSCVGVDVVDKKHERYIGNSGLDLSPAAVELITGKPATPYWSGKVEEC